VVDAGQNITTPEDSDSETEVPSSSSDPEVRI